MRILLVFGTRPEAIKLAPVAAALKARPRLEVKICVTAQHREMLDQVLDSFDLNPDYDLNLMQPQQTLSSLTADCVRAISKVVQEYRPSWVIVQGDTTTTFCGALAAFYERARVAHVEAGLRTGNLMSPWPEELNRQLTSRIAQMHFAPTNTAAQHLLREGVDQNRIHVTGNTVIDALLEVQGRIQSDTSLRRHLDEKFRFLDPRKRLLLVTGHRRESFGQALENVCSAIAVLAQRPDVEIIYPVHMNPSVQQTVNGMLARKANIHLIAPFDYVPFVYIMSRADFIISDSGGIQEEAPALGKPVLVTRTVTERMEAVEAGTARLVGSNTDLLVREANVLLNDREAYQRMAQARNPFGDGKASTRIADLIEATLGDSATPTQ